MFLFFAGLLLLRRFIVPPPMDNEVYAIDLDKEKRMILYGGGNDKCVVVDMDTGETLTVIENFEDSVVFCKFVGNEKLIIGSLDGTLVLTTFEEEINSVSVCEDTTKIVQADDKLVVGTSQGTVHLFNLDLEVQIVCIGQRNEIKDLDYENGRIYTLSETNFIVFNAETHQRIYDLCLEGGTAFSRIPSTDIVCIGMAASVAVYKNTKLISKISTEGTPECVLYFNDCFLIGGDFCHIMLINMRMNARVFKLSIGVAGISVLKRDGMNSVAFGTYHGVVGYGDIRDEKSFKIFYGRVGAVFDLCIGEGAIYVGGEDGLDMLDIEACNDSCL